MPGFGTDPSACRTTAERWSPASGARPVIHGNIVVIVERTRTDSGGVTFGIYSRQASAGLERPALDPGDFFGNGDGAQTGAPGKCPDPDIGHTVGDDDVREAGAVRERIAADGDDAFGERVASGFAFRASDDHGLVLIEQDPVNAAKDGVECIDRDGR